MAGKNILFISIFDLTKVFDAISKKLPASNKYFWITTNELWTNYLLDQGTERDKILQLIYKKSDFLTDDEKSELLKELIKNEKEADLNIFQSIIMDRFLMFSNMENIEDYVFLYYREISKFLLKHKIDIVFGEPTNFNELLIYIVTKGHNIDFIAPNHMRYPSDRVVFTKGYLKSELVKLNNSQDRELGKQYFEQFKSERELPSYFTINNKQRVFDILRITNSIMQRIGQYRKGSVNHLTHHPLKERISYNLRKVINSFILRKIQTYKQLNVINKKIAFYGIHVQPENSIDVIASFFSDQVKLIKDIRRSLPFDFTLIVKEHPNKLGSKPLMFYSEIRRIPGVEIIHPLTNAFEIMEMASLVFTVSGTTAYEAGLLGKPAIMFSPLFFNGLSTISYCNNISELSDLVKKSINRDQDQKNDEEVMADLFENSNSGYWTDPYTDEKVLDDKNIEKLAVAFDRVISKC
ncbi:hypothetical protein [Reichenbachiella sp. MALMAid0571]|uniref:hypothetical protein n=1 Tax=Reichenbachiella sp. MALMAid0571 TaxID=3143939 RepID=UPI0032DEABA0